MTSENPQEVLSVAADGSTTVWDTSTYGSICYGVEWQDLNATNGVMELQVSLDKVNWNCYGQSAGQFTLNSASGYQTLEVAPVVFPYWRLKYTHGGVTSGSIVVRSYGKPLHRMT